MTSTTLRSSLGGLAASLILFTASAADGVDGVIEINQAKALAGGVTLGDAPGYPVSISSGGSYRLTGDLSVPANTDGIVAGENLTLDLNGFRIAGQGSGTGIGAGNFLTVTNGSIDGMGSAIASGFSARIEGVRANGHSADGIVVGAFSVIRGNVVRSSGQRGIVTGANSLIVQNVGTHNGGVALDTFSSGYGDNVFNDNNLGGPQVSIGAPPATQLGPNVCDNDTVCP